MSWKEMKPEFERYLNSGRWMYEFDGFFFFYIGDKYVGFYSPDPNLINRFTMSYGFHGFERFKLTDSDFIDELTLHFGIGLFHPWQKHVK